MASVERRERDGNVTWRAHWREPGGRQRNKTFARKLDADRHLRAVETAKDTGQYIGEQRARITVDELVDEWLAGKVNIKATTRARYEAALNVHVLPRWGRTPVGKVQHGDVQAWIAQLVGSGLSAASVQKCSGVLSAVLARAVRDRRIASNPADGVDLPRVVERRRRYLTAGQVEALADAAAALPPNRPVRATPDTFAQYRLAVLVLAYCGLRWSELAALRSGRVDLMRRRLLVAEAVTEVDGARLVWGTPKSHESRSVPLPRFLVDDLAAHLTGHGTDDLVFTAPGGGVLRNRNARRAWFDRAAGVAGVRGLTPHELRHTAASLAVSAGANVKAVQRMLGHASAAMTLDRYADLFDDDLDAVAERLDTARAAAVARALPDATVVDIGRVALKARGQ